MSPSPDLPDWRGVCYGRDALLRTLQDAYGRASVGLAEIHILLGMPGIGKTRLAQELYRWLTREHDQPQAGFPQGYWPDAFADQGTQDRVNPVFDDRPRPPIPFLWWGLKFDEQDPAEAVWRARRDLSPHLAYVVAARQIAQIKGDWYWRALNWSMQGAGLIPWLGLVTNLPGWVKDGYDIWGNQREQAAAKQATQRSFQESQQAQDAELIADLLSSFRLFLDPAVSTVPTVPIVLLLDDAHWADATTLEFVKRLYGEARERKWPLLILATHWEDVWGEHQQQGAAGSKALTLAMLQASLADAPRAGVYTHAVCGVEDTALETWLTDAVPGVPVEQRRILLDKARAAAVDASGQSVPGGSPRVLRQLLDWLLDDPRDSFDDGTPRSPLRPGVVETIQRDIHDLKDIIERRFKTLDREVRKALGWSSRQGERFLGEITRQVARRLADGNPAGTPTHPGHLEIETGLRRAYRPGHWIDEVPQPRIDPGRFNLCEFRSNIFYEIARRHFTRDSQEIAAVDEAVRAVLADWVRSERLALPSASTTLDAEGLTIAERRDALRMAVRQWRPAGPATATEATLAVYGRALAQWVALEREAWRWGEPVGYERIEAGALAFVAAFPRGCPVAVVPCSWQVTILDGLLQMQEYAAAEQLAEPLAVALEGLARTAEGDWRGGDEPVLKEYAIVLQRLGDLQSLAGKRSPALETYRRCLEVTSRRAVVTVDPDRLRDVSVSLERVADALRGLGEPRLTIDGAARTPLELYVESLDVCRRIVRDFGESPEALRDVCISCKRLGDLALRNEPRTGETLRAAAMMFQESLGLWETLRERYGESPDTLEGPWVSLRGLALICLMTDQRELAKTLLARARPNLELVLARGWEGRATRGKLDAIDELERLLEEGTEG